jgi:hypothetical protein
VRRLACGLLVAVTVAAAGCGVKGPPRPSGAPERPAPAAPKDTISAAPAAPATPVTPVTPATEAAK